MSADPRILVLTLHSGENEFEACKASVATQTLAAADHVVFSGLGNVAAHAALYRRVMDSADAFDLFLKLDADMVLSRDTALREVADYFRSHPGTDHLEVFVNDYFSGHLIAGVHTFTSRVTWAVDGHDTLFIDPKPDYPGVHVFNPPDLASFVDHAPDPSPYQAFHFGYHRALKAFQPDRAKKRLAWTEAQLATLDGVRAQYARTGDARLGLTLLAAGMVARGTLSGHTGDKSAADVQAAFEQVEGLSAEQVAQRVAEEAPRWATLTRRLLRSQRFRRYWPF